MTTGIYLKDIDLKDLSEKDFKLLVTDLYDDYYITVDNLYIYNKINQLIYNEVENVYSFEELNISKDTLTNNLHLMCCVRASEINTKKGTSIKLSDGEIIPILHPVNNSTISANGLNDGLSNFYYDSSLNAFIFSNRHLPIGAMPFIHGTHRPNGFIKCDKEIKGEDYPSLESVGNNSIPILDNYSLRNAGSLAPYNTRQEDGLQNLGATIRVKTKQEAYNANNSRDTSLVSTKTDYLYGGSSSDYEFTFYLQNKDDSNPLRLGSEVRSKKYCSNLYIRG